jgi:hypothetical protein
MHAWKTGKESGEEISNEEIKCTIQKLIFLQIN